MFVAYLMICSQVHKMMRFAKLCTFSFLTAGDEKILEYFLRMIKDKMILNARRSIFLILLKHILTTFGNIRFIKNQIIFQVSLKINEI